MAGKQVQRRRGSTAEHAAFVGAVGEVTVDTTRHQQVVHDGATPGGFRQARESDLVDLAAEVDDIKAGTVATPVTYTGGVLDLSAKPPGAYTVALNANITSVLLPAGHAGRQDNLSIQFTQAGVGTYTVTGWPAGVSWSGGVAPQVQLGVGAITYLELRNLNNSGWVGGQSGGGPVGGVFYENSTTVATSYTISTGKNAMSAGPITIATGVTVTVPTGSTWSVI